MVSACSKCRNQFTTPSAKCSALTTQMDDVIEKVNVEYVFLQDEYGQKQQTASHYASHIR